jgi:hypothetical protein
MTAVIPFAFDDALVRALRVEHDPWFVLSDVCKVLGISNNRNVTARLDDDEKGVHSMDTPGGPQEMTIISERALSDAEVDTLTDAHSACQASIARHPCRTADDMRVMLDMLIAAHEEAEFWLYDWEEELLQSVLAATVALNGGMQ